MKLRIRRARAKRAVCTERTATVGNKPIPYALVPRCSDLLSIQDTLASVAQEVLPEAGANDSKYFAAVDVAEMVIPRPDVSLISSTLLSLAIWEKDAAMMDLFHRLPFMEQNHGRDSGRR